MRILIVGSGFSGSVIARELAETGLFRITIIDRRDHIAGNAYDPIHPLTERRYHQYGPHIFHTNGTDIVDYLSQFTGWLPYAHRVRALLPSGLVVPMPINRVTVNSHYGVNLTDNQEVIKFLDNLRKHNDNAKNALEYLQSIYGEELTELFFGRYTRKMWGLDIADMPVSVVARLPVRYGDDDGYFDDKYQIMHADGYLSLFERMLDDPNIDVKLDTEFSKSMEGGYGYVFISMPIDEYFDNQFGPLPYRSIKFEHRFDEAFDEVVPTINFTDNGKYTRKTSWALYPGCGGIPGQHVTYEGALFL